MSNNIRIKSCIGELIFVMKMHHEGKSDFECLREHVSRSR